MPSRLDRVLTIALLVEQFIISATLAAVSAFSLIQVGSCTSVTCNIEGANLALFITPSAALIALVACLVVASNRMSRERRAWWVPVVGMMAVALAFGIQLFVVAVALRVWE